MIVAAALCPAPPLLIRELTGAAQVAADLRDACLACVTELVAAAHDLIAVVGAAERTGVWGETAALDLSRYAPGPALMNGRRAGAQAGLPSALGVGAWLLGEAGAHGRRLLQSIGDEPPARCASLGAELAGRADRVALL